MQRLATLSALSALITLGLASCDTSETGEPSYLEGMQDACAQAQGTWDAESETCAPAVPDQNWLVIQDAEGVTFALDDTLDAACPEEAFWSGTMTMTGADTDTLWFSDRPFRHAYTQTTQEFIAGFGDTFSEDSGGDPNAVLNWKDTATMEEQHAVIELRYVDASSPSFDADTQTLSYAVCGLKLDDPTTLMPLPDDQQVQPPAAPMAQGEFSLFIDSVLVGQGAVCGSNEATTNCYWRGVCGNDAWAHGSCASKGLPPPSWSDDCRIDYREGRALAMDLMFSKDFGWQGSDSTEYLSAGPFGLLIVWADVCR
jgi:hypothetical protein